MNSDARRVELEIAGERVTVEGWPSGLASPVDAVAVSGEAVRVEVAHRSSSGRARASGAAPPPSVPPGRPGAEPVAAGDIVPPMPGKILEVRVTTGQSVERGQVLFVLEAMKMRNEVAAPIAGKVVEIRVAPGANVRAREILVRIEPS